MEPNAIMNTRRVARGNSVTSLPAAIEIPWIYVTIPTLYESEIEFDSPAEVVEFCEAICAMSEYIDEEQEGIWNECDGWDFIIDDPTFITNYTRDYNGIKVTDSDQWLAPFETAVENSFASQPHRFRNVTMDQVYSSNVDDFEVKDGQFVRSLVKGNPPRVSTSPDIEYTDPDVVEYDDSEAHY